MEESKIFSYYENVELIYFQANLKKKWYEISYFFYVVLL